MSQTCQYIQRPTGLPGYTPSTWCCVCGKTVKKNNPSTFYSCNTTTTCINYCHKECLGEREIFKCDLVEELRRENNSTQPVTYSLPPSDNTIPEDVTQIAEHQHTESVDLTHKSKEQLIEDVKRLTLKLDKLEPSHKKLELIIKEVTKRREEVVNVLSWIDQLTAAANTVIQAITSEACTQTCQAEFPNSIPNVTNTTTTTNIIETATVDVTNIASADNTVITTTDVVYVASTDTEFQPNTTDNHNRTPTESVRQRHSATASGGGIRGTTTRKRKQKKSTPSVQVEEQGSTSGSATHSAPPEAPKDRPGEGSKPPIRQSTQASTCGWCKKKGHTEKNCRSHIWCEFCGRSGHSVDWCRTLVESERWEQQCWVECSYCRRTGHSHEQCRTRTADARQERFLRSLVEEQTNQTASILRSIQNSFVGASATGGLTQRVGLQGAGQPAYLPQFQVYPQYQLPIPPQPQDGGRQA